MLSLCKVVTGLGLTAQTESLHLPCEQHGFTVGKYIYAWDHFGIIMHVHLPLCGYACGGRGSRIGPSIQLFLRSYT